VVSVLGEPKVKAKREWRWGNGNGSLAVVMYGDKRGLWVDRADIGNKGAGGDLFKLIGGDAGFGVAVERACHIVGYNPPSHDGDMTDEQRRARAEVIKRDRVRLAEERARQQAAAEKKQKAEDAAAIAKARMMVAARTAPQDSPAKPYVTVTRRIPLSDGDWPPGLGWHPGERALIAAGTTKAGLITCVQIVRLTDAGHKRVNCQLVKQTFGPLKTEHGRSALRLPTRPGADPALLCHAEGIESGLSAWIAFGAETWVALGSGFDPEPDRLNIILADDDAADSKRARSLALQKLAWREAGFWYVVASPWETPRGDGSDLNDTIKAGGVEAVCERIQSALASRPRPPTVPPTVPVPPLPPTITTDDLRDAVELPIMAWAQQATVRADERLQAQRTEAQRKGNAAYQGKVPQGQQGIAMSGVGSGKTDAALKAIAEMLTTPTAPRNPPRRIVINVQDHALAENVIKRADKILPAGTPRQIHLGYNRPNPNDPGFDDKAIATEDKVKQCTRAKDMEAVMKAGGAMATLCGCPAQGFCEFSAQTPKVENPCGYTTTETIDNGLLILVGPEALKQGAPASFKRSIKYFNPETRRTNKLKVDVADFVVIDEPKPTALIGPAKEDGSAYDVAVGELIAPLTMFGDMPEGVDAEEIQAAADLVSHSMDELDRLLMTLTSGPLSHEACTKVNAKAHWADVRRNAFKFKVAIEDYIKPSMKGEALFNALNKLARHNSRIMQIERVCRSLMEAAEAMRDKPKIALSGLVSLRHIPAHKDKPEARVLLLRWVVPVHKDWMGPPTLLLDAEAKPDVMRKWWPKLEILTTARLPTPSSVYRRQVHDSAFSYMSYAPRDPTNPPAIGESHANRRENTCWNNVRWLLRFITVKLNQYKDQAKDGAYDVLVIAPQRTEQALRALWSRLGGVPSRLSIIHYQNFAGLNQFAHVRYLCMVGRPQTPTDIFEAIAWVVNGVIGEVLPDGQLPLVDGAYLMRDGTARLARVRHHPDPMAEQIRTILVTNQLIQGEGRPRGIWRTPDNPLHIDHLCDVPLPDLLVDSLVTLESVKQEGTTSRWLLASGLCPVADERGYQSFVAAVTGSSLNAVKVQARKNPDWLVSFGHPTTMPVFQVKLPDERYAMQVAINADTVEAAKLRLSTVGITDASVTGPPPPPKEPGDVIDRMATRGLVLFSATHAAAMYPELFKYRSVETGSAECAIKAINRARFVASKFPDKSGLNGVFLHRKIISLLWRLTPLSDPLSGNWIGLYYRIAGVGQQGAFAVVEASRLTVSRQEMEVRLGQLEVFEVVPNEPKPAPTPEPLVFPPTLVPSHKRPPWKQGQRMKPLRPLSPLPGTHFRWKARGFPRVDDNV